jgi:hypothetical protein
MSGHPFLHLGSIRDIEGFARHLGEQQIMVPCHREIVTGTGSPLARRALPKKSLNCYKILSSASLQGLKKTLWAKPIDGILSATVITPRGVDAEALSKAVMVMGIEKAKDFLKPRKDARAFLYYRQPEGNVGSIRLNY